MTSGRSPFFCAIMALVIGQLTIGPTIGFAKERNQRVLILYSNQNSGRVAENLKSVLRTQKIDSVLRSVDLEPLKDTGRTKKGRDLLKEAKHLYRDLVLLQALEKLIQAQNYSDLSTLREIFLTKALIGQIREDNEEAKAALETYIILGGGDLDDAYHPPVFIEIFRRAKRSARSRPVSVLRVHPRKGSQTDSQIYVDGRHFGQGPIRIKNLKVGYHLLRIETAGYYPFSKTVFLHREGTKLEPELKPIPSSDLAIRAFQSRKETERAKLLAKLQKKTKAAGVIMLSSNQIALYSNQQRIWSRPLNTGEISGLEDVLQIRDALLGPPDAPTIAEANLESPLSDSSLSLLSLSRSPSTLPPSQAVAKPPTRSWYRKWWVWTLIGSAAAAGGGAYFVFGRSGGSSPSSTVNLSVGPQ